MLKKYVGQKPTSPSGLLTDIFLYCVVLLFKYADYKLNLSYLKIFFISRLLTKQNPAFLYKVWNTLYKNAGFWLVNSRDIFYKFRPCIVNLQNFYFM